MWQCRMLGRVDISTDGFLSTQLMIAPNSTVGPAARAYAAVPDGVPAKQGQI